MLRAFPFIFFLAVLFFIFSTNDTANGVENRSYYQIVVMSDLHLPGKALPLKERARENINSWPDVDLVVILGDFCRDTGTAEEYSDAKQYISKLTKPYAIVIGNHEYLYDDARNSQGNLTKAQPTIRKEKLDRAMSVFNMSELYYSKQVGQYKLLLLSTDSLYSDRNTALSDKQVEWFQAELAKAKDKPTIVFCHSPLRGTLMGENWVVNNSDFWIHPELKIKEIIKDNPQVFLWVSGHTHTAPTHAAYAHDINLYEKQVTNIHNPEMTASGFVSEKDKNVSVHRTMWTNSIFLYPDKVVVKTYNHNKQIWLDHLTREIKPPKLN
jgi:predicted MPP superfamily phosphohydrolase